MHHFDETIAAEYGVNCAVVFEYIRYWVERNAKAGKNYHDGRYWTFSSKPELAEQFPYLTAERVRRALEKLRAKGLIMVGNYNQRPFDRTLWYTLTDEGTAIWQHRQMQTAKMPDGRASPPHGQASPPDGRANSPDQYHIHTPLDTPLQTALSEDDAQRARASESGSNWRRFALSYEANIGKLPTSAVEREDLRMFYDEFGADALIAFAEATARKHPDNPHVYFATICRKNLGAGISSGEQARVALREFARQHERRAHAGQSLPTEYPDEEHVY